MRAARLLTNWVVLNEYILQLGEKEVVRLLAYEKQNANRITFVYRLHSRLNRLRRERERKAIAMGD